MTTQQPKHPAKQPGEGNSRFPDAVAYAIDKHAGQFRKASEPRIPYYSHLIGVAALVLDHGGNEDEAVAGLLHDAVEDTLDSGGGRATLAEIRERFGDDVADIVAGCSDSFTRPKPPWEERKQAYVDKLRSATPSIVLVSLCDKLHNASSLVEDYRILGEALWGRFKRGKELQLWYYEQLLAGFESRRDDMAANPRYAVLVERFERVVGELADVAG